MCEINVNIISIGFRAYSKNEKMENGRSLDHVHFENYQNDTCRGLINCFTRKSRRHCLFLSLLILES